MGIFARESLERITPMSSPKATLLSALSRTDSPRRETLRRELARQADRPPRRPQAQAGAGQRLAAAADAAGPGRHRARCAATVLDRRDAPRRDAARLVTRLARTKAETARDQIANDKDIADAYVLAADTVVAVGRRILMKPRNIEEELPPCSFCRAAPTAC